MSRAYITVTTENAPDATTLARVVEAALREAGFRHVVQLAPRHAERGFGLFPVERGRIKDCYGEDYQVTVTTSIREPPKGKR